ncbi:MAG: tetratricopeptide repeat protein [Bacteroidota bacterium]
MEENLDSFDEEVKASLLRYEDMLKSKSNYYFDVFEFEHIIDFYLDKNDLKNANQVLKYALNQHPNSTSLLLKQAQAHINKGFPVKSLKLLRKLEKIESSNYSIFYMQGAVYCSLGDVNKAIKVFKKALAVSFDAKEELLFNIGMTFKQISRYDLSNNYFLELYELDNVNKTVIYELAHNYEKLDQDDISVSYYKEYINIDPFSLLAWYSLGLVYNKLEEYDLAVEAFEYVIAIDPGHISAYFQKAVNMYYNEKVSESIDAFIELLELDKDNISAIFHIGEAYAKLKNTEKASEYFDKAIELDEQYADAWYGKAYLLYENKKYIDALHSIKNAIKYDDEDPDFWYLSALICRELGFIDESEKSFKKTIKLDDSDPKIWIEYSKLNFGQSKIFKTINILSEANELFEDNADINYRLAANLAKIDNINSAIFHLKLALNKEVDKLGVFRSIFMIKNEKIEEIIDQFFETKQSDN